jgi:hypothetical protein
VTRADFVVGLLLAAFFGATLWEGWSFQYGTEFAPGPGFAPVWLSAIGVCVSLLIAAHGLRAMRGDDRSAAAPSLDKRGLVRVALTLVGLAVMVFFMESLGLVLALLALLLYLTLVVQRHGLGVGIGASVGTVAFVYVVFVHFLDVPIPKGPLGF